MLVWLVATASGFDETWEDGLTARAPEGLAAVTTLAAVGAFDVGFGDLALSAGWRAIPGKPAIGVTAHVGAVATPGGAVGPLHYRETGADFWVMFRGQRDLHGLSLGAHLPPHQQTGWYRFHPSEGGERGLARYDLLMDREPVDIALDLRFGHSTVFGPEVSGRFVVIGEVTPRLRASAGLMAAVAPEGVGLAGVHWRPADGVEVGLNTGASFPTFDDGVARWHVAVDVKAFAGPTAAAAPAPPP